MNVNAISEEQIVLKVFLIYFTIGLGKEPREKSSPLWALSNAVF
jgi:hypothetical protein